ncbi:MAG: FKBP-type peptidyl-prolyl cis-trans isomerase [Cytophagaceae bacterium]
MKTLLVFLAFSFSISLASAQQKDTITTPSGLKYVCTKKGDGENPQKGQKIKVYYTGKFLNGTAFESNRGDKPFKFTLGKREVIPGWDEGFLLMSKGEKGVLIIPSHLAYGKRGVKNPYNDQIYDIPPNTDLIFEVEVVSFK